MRKILAVLVLIVSVLGTTSPAVGAPWVPAAGAPWQWQLSGRLDLSVPVPTFDVDGFDTSASQVASLHALGRHAICYLDMGGAENYRPDYGLFPASVLGNTVGGWPAERWVDVRQIAALQPIITSRFDMCRTKGFDAVEADLADGYANNTGFPISQADQLRWNDHLAAEAHTRGMSFALKNAPELAAREVTVADFVIVEECEQYSECGAFLPFVAAGKAVLHTEYQGTVSKICSRRPVGFSTMKKRLELGAWRRACP